MSSRWLGTLVLPGALLAGACAQSEVGTSSSSLPAGRDGQATASAAGLEGPTWKLTELVWVGASAPLPSPDAFTAQFGDGRVSVKSDCNRCSGGYTAEDPRLSIGLMACTRAYCSSSPLDSRYEQALQGAQSYSVEGARLTIRSAGGRLTFDR